MNKDCIKKYRQGEYSFLMGKCKCNECNEDMTNKLPEVKKGYRLKTNHNIISEVIALWGRNKEIVIIGHPGLQLIDGVWVMYVDKFFKEFEELPDQPEPAKIKLPEVGKRYRPKHDNLRNFYEFEYEVIATTSKRLVVKILKSRFEHLIDTIKDYDLNLIDKKLEELPDQPTEEKPMTIKHFENQDSSDAINEMRGDSLGRAILEVMGENTARDTIKNIKDSYATEGWVDMSKPEPKKEEVESIWKPVSELPPERNQVIVKMKNGTKGLCFYEYEKFHVYFLVTGQDAVGRDILEYRTMNNVSEWCYITDYINNIEERLTKLEAK